ncbi:uncharacterized protein LOC129918123 [Episyrphus balteatus]|uniref:uncharacterized protein LOC129918123 n=1 Tax=Episyrphus balteatus TaxID=286459 RepID=UPI0024854F1D|nr:uncharacterized protein LOC129918123 [Episyrphus balteatus]
MSMSLEVPLILLTENETCFIKKHFNNNFLVVVLMESWNDELLNGLLESLHQIRLCKIIFILEDSSYLMDLFKFCWTNGMINAITVLKDFEKTTLVHTYSNFPVFVIEEIKWKMRQSMEKFFPDRLRDLHGYQLPLLVGGPDNNMLVSKNKLGEIVLKGCVGHLFQAFLSKHNLKIKPSNISLHLPAQQILQLVLNQSIELSTAATYPAIPMDLYTYPFDLSDWCIMLPIEPRIPIFEVFMIIFHPKALIILIGIMTVLSALLESAITLTIGGKSSLLNYFIKNSVFRGILGQSFAEEKKATITIKLIYLLICLLGLNIVTSYGAFLQTFITHPPSGKRIESFDDLLASKMKVYSLKAEVDRLTISEPRFRQKYYDMFLFEKNFTKYLNLNYFFNTNYAYVVTNIKWIIIQHRQKTYSRLLFRLPKDMCMFRNIPLVFPINENSIFKDVLNYLLIEVQSSGLMDFWKRRVFYELVEAGKLQLDDSTVKRSAEPLKVKDLMSVWINLVLAYFVGILCFLCEISVYRRKIRKENEARWKWFLD